MLLKFSRKEKKIDIKSEYIIFVLQNNFTPKNVLDFLKRSFHLIKL